jgi:hypothetical protein
MPSSIRVEKILHGAPTLIISREDRAALTFCENECVSYANFGNIVIIYGHFYDAEEFLQFALNWVKGSTAKGA